MRAVRGRISWGRALVSAAVLLLAAATAVGIAPSLTVATAVSSASGASSPLPATASAPVTVRVDAEGDTGGDTGLVVNKQLLGVDGPGPTGATASMAALGLRWVRTDVGFDGSYDCATGTWDPSSLDAKVKQIYAEGASPLLIVDYTPPCLAPEPDVPSPGSVTYEPPDVGTHDGVSDQSIWDGLVYQMAVHEIAEGVRSFEIWNEPDGEFWYGGLPGYLHLYQDTATVLEAAAAAAGVSIEVGGPALFFADASWIEPFLAFVAANHLPLDFLSWHYYGDYPALGPDGPIPMPPSVTPPLWYNPALRAQTFGDEVAQVRAEVAAFPQLHPLLWIDEWNVDAGYDARQDGPYDAAFAAAVLDSVQAAGLARMSFFDVSDSTTDQRGDWGMLTADLSPKPVYRAFAYWDDLAPNELPVTLSPDQVASDPVGRVGAVASTGAGGVVTVLVYNFVPYDPTGGYGTVDPTPYDHTVDVLISGLGGGSYLWSRDVVDGSHTGGLVDQGSVIGPTVHESFTLAGEGVTLLTLTPASTPVSAPAGTPAP